MNITLVDKKLFVASQAVGISVYDFNFELNFSCSHPYRIEQELPCVLRVGAIADYAAVYAQQLSMGLRLVNSVEEHARASELEHWYPLIEDLTPRSVVFDELPPAGVIEQQFAWPVFIKGTRQTSKHNPDLSIARDRRQYETIVRLYQDDPILHWQRPVIREFVPLASVPGQVPGKVAPSIEYRSFWWHGRCVGWGRYWYQLAAYDPADVQAGLIVAQTAARRLAVPFLVVDFAKTADGRWIVIECNDAQESGYAGVPPGVLWRNVLDDVDAGA